MSKSVFLSSGVKGLEKYREDVCRAIERLDGYQCIRMENFGARNCDSDEYCRDRVKASDVFVALVGHRYGSCVPGSTRSYSECEYDAAIELGKPCLVFLASENFLVPANLDESEELRERQRSFRARVQKDRITGYFENHEELATAVVQAIHNVQETSGQSGKLQSRLLFPFVSNQYGYDTGIAVTNASPDGLCGVEPQAGACTVHFYGGFTGDVKLRETERKFAWKQESCVLWPGEQLRFTLSGGGEQQLITPAAGFQGYLVVDCKFGAAYGVAAFGPMAKPNTMYIAERVLVA